MANKDKLQKLSDYFNLGPDKQTYIRMIEEGYSPQHSLHAAFMANPNNVKNNRLTNDALRMWNSENDLLRSGEHPFNFIKSKKKNLSAEQLDELAKFQSKINDPNYKLSPNDFKVEKYQSGKDGRYRLLNPITEVVMGDFPYTTYDIPIQNYQYLLDLDNTLKDKYSKISNYHEGKGNYAAFSNQIDNLLKMSYPEVTAELQGRGLGNQMYSLIEKETNKKIMPDTILTDFSKNLHKNHGLGKKFGSDNYKDFIVQSLKKAVKKLSDTVEDTSIEKLTDAQINELAEKGYEKFKGKMKYSLPDFKSFAPTFIKGAGGATLAKIAAAGATGGATALVNAAEQIMDTPSSNEGEKNEMDMWKIEEDLKRARQNNPQMKEIFEKADDELRTYGVSDLINPEADPSKPQFKQLLNKLNRK